MCQFQTVYLRLEEWEDYDFPSIFVDLREHGIGFCFFEQEEEDIADAKEVLVIAASQELVDAANDCGLPVLAVELDDTAIYHTSFVLQGTDGLTYDYCRKVFQRAHNQPWEIAKTKRCLIEELSLDCLDEMMELYKDASVREFVRLPYEDRKKEEEYEKAYIENMYGFYGYGIWLVRSRKTNELIGRAGLERRLVEGEDSLEIGYFISSKYQRQGYATEVCQAVLEIAASLYPGGRIHAYIEENNTASKALIQKLGFVRERRVELNEKKMERFAALTNKKFYRKNLPFYGKMRDNKVS